MPIFRSETVVVERDSDGSAVLVLDVPDRAYNVFNLQVLSDLEGALDAVAADGHIPLLVLRSGKKSGFLAGADLHEFLKIKDLAAARALSERGQRLFDKLADLPMTRVAEISGPCMGRGQALAM